MTAAGVGGALIAGSALGFGALAYGIFAPRSRLLCPVIGWGDRSGPGRVAMTFDDGPQPGATEAILEILDRAGVQAAFFVIGVHARRWPSIVRKIDAAGHIVGNHTNAHPHWGAVRHAAYWLAELDGASDAIADAIGKRPALFRPPLGYKNWHLAAAARERGYTVVTWSNRGLDGLRTTPERIVRRVVGHAAAGQIIGLHDGVDPHRTRDPAATIAALAPVLAGLRERGLGFERLDRLIGRPAYASAAVMPGVGAPAEAAGSPAPRSM